MTLLKKIWSALEMLIVAVLLTTALGNVALDVLIILTAVISESFLNDLIQGVDHGLLFLYYVEASFVIGLVMMFAVAIPAIKEFMTKVIKRS